LITSTQPTTLIHIHYSTVSIHTNFRHTEFCDIVCVCRIGNFAQRRQIHKIPTKFYDLALNISLCLIPIHFSGYLLMHMTQYSSMPCFVSHKTVSCVYCYSSRIIIQTEQKFCEFAHILTIHWPLDQHRKQHTEFARNLQKHCTEFPNLRAEFYALYTNCRALHC